MPTDPYGLDYGQISGASLGGQNLTDMLNYLRETLEAGNYFGEQGASAPSGAFDMMQGWSTNPSMQGELPFNAENLTGFLGTMYGSSQEELDWQPNQVPENWGNISSAWQSSFPTGGGQSASGMEDLYGLLQNLDLPGSRMGYMQDVGDVSTEISSQLGGLQKGYGLGTKGSRYGQIGTGGRTTGDISRGQYASDFYGLEQKEQEMMGSMQEGYQSDFYNQMMQYLGMTSPTA